jgi:hypothetical protein
VLSQQPISVVQTELRWPSLGEKLGSGITTPIQHLRKQRGREGSGNSYHGPVPSLIGPQYPRQITLESCMLVDLLGVVIPTVEDLNSRKCDYAGNSMPKTSMIWR